MTPPKSSLALIGLGSMGSRMLRHLAASELIDIAVFDVDPAAMDQALELRGVSGLSSAAEAAKADQIILMLPDSKVIDYVLGDVNDEQSLAGQLRAGAFVIDMGSSDPARTQRRAEEFQRHGVTFLDAPVSGGPRKAESADLTIMVGAPSEDVFQAALPTLRLLGRSITHVGDVGSGHALKALNNLLSAAGLVAAIEALTVAARFGLDPSIALDVINRSTGRNQSTEVKLRPHVLEGAFDVGFSLPLSVKDVQTALALAEALDLDIPVSSAAGGVMDRALRWRGSHSNPDQSEVALYIEHLSGVRLRP